MLSAEQPAAQHDRLTCHRLDGDLARNVASLPAKIMTSAILPKLLWHGKLFARTKRALTADAQGQIRQAWELVDGASCWGLERRATLAADVQTKFKSHARLDRSKGIIFPTARTASTRVSGPWLHKVLTSCNVPTFAVGTWLSGAVGRDFLMRNDLQS